MKKFFHVDENSLYLSLEKCLFCDQDFGIYEVYYYSKASNELVSVEMNTKIPHKALGNWQVWEVKSSNKIRTRNDLLWL